MNGYVEMQSQIDNMKSRINHMRDTQTLEMNVYQELLRTIAEITRKMEQLED